jgi:hypothetical protein
MTDVALAAEAQSIVDALTDEQCDAVLAAIEVRADRWELEHGRSPSKPMLSPGPVHKLHRFPVMVDPVIVAVATLALAAVMLALDVSWAAVVWLTAVGVMFTCGMVYRAILKDAQQVRDFWSP